MTRMKINSSVFVIIILLFSFCSEKQSKGVLFSSIEGNFKIRFPSLPKEDSVKQETKYGQLTTSTFLYVDEENQSTKPSFAVAYTDFPDTVNVSSDEMQTRIYDEVIDASINSTMGDLLDKKDINYKGLKGKETRVKLSNGKFLITSRYFMFGRRLYTLQIVAPKDKIFNPISRQFLDSFEISR